MNAVAVYQVTNTANGSRYVGISQKPGRRFHDHRSLSRTRPKTKFHRALRKHGPEVFEFKVVAGFPNVALARLAEISLIRFTKPEYNLTAGGEGVWGLKHTEETKAKNRAARLGKKHTEEAKRKIAEAGRGRNPNAETRARISAGKMGCSRPDSKGMPRTQEVRDKISKTKQGKPSPLKGVPRSPETIAKMSAAATGRQHSSEARIKMREAAQNRQTTKKNNI